MNSSVSNTQVLAFYQSKPWLNKAEKQEPWRAELRALRERVSRLEKTVPPVKPDPMVPANPAERER